MLFKKIEIQNFRGIESLTMNNLKQINLLTGRNNCGKTSILEAIFLLTGISNTRLAYDINLFRKLTLTENKDFSFIFKNLDFINNPCLKGELDFEERLLTIKPIYQGFTQNLTKITEKRKFSTEELMSETLTKMARNPIEGIEYVFNVNHQEYKSTIKIIEDQITLTLAEDYQENLSGRLMNDNTITSAVIARSLEPILVTKNLNTIINPLKEIEPKLLDIKMGAESMVYIDIGIDKLVPLNVMGDGIIKIIGILVAISDTQNGILMIDEVENGLHYSTLSVLWKAVLKSAVDNNVQLFITTHSYECVQALTEVCKAQTSYIDLISLFRIERNSKGQHQSFQYEADVLLAGIENEFEVR